MALHAVLPCHKKIRPAAKELMTEIETGNSGNLAILQSRNISPHIISLHSSSKADSKH